MEIGVVLKDRCKDDAIKCWVDEQTMARVVNSVVKGNFFITSRYIIPMSEIKYIYKISD